MRVKLKHIYLLWLVFILCLIVPAFTAAVEEIRVTGIRVHQDALTLPLGERDIVTVTVYPGNATDDGVYWKVSDPQIIAVTDLGHSAEVNALTPGTAVLTAVTRDGGFYDSCEITTIVLVRTLSMELSSIDLSVGEEFQLSVTIEPPDATDQRLIWESTEPTVATVSEEGNVIALREGETRIVARSMQDETITDYVDVTVLSAALVAPDPDTAPTMPVQPAPAPGEGSLNRLLIGGLSAVVLAAALAVVFLVRHKKKERQPRPVLKGLTGYFAGQAMELSGGQLVIGRDSAHAQLVYSPDYETISRKHCAIRFDRHTGQFILEDFSTAGTFLSSGEKLDPGSPRRIAPGSQFYLSDVGELFSVELV